MKSAEQQLADFERGIDEELARIEPRAKVKAVEIDAPAQTNGHAALDVPDAISPEEFGLPAAETAERVEEPVPAASRPKQRFPLVAFDQVKVDTKRRGYLIKGLLASTGLAVIWGPPKCGKIFWAVDMAMHIALGWDYRGRRVQQAPVVYVALEGQHGFPARIEAFRHHHDIDISAIFSGDGRAQPDRRRPRPGGGHQGADRRRSCPAPCSSIRSTAAWSAPRARTRTWRSISPRLISSPINSAAQW